METREAESRASVGAVAGVADVDAGGGVAVEEADGPVQARPKTLWPTQQWW